MARNITRAIRNASRRVEPQRNARRGARDALRSTSAALRRVERRINRAREGADTSELTSRAAALRAEKGKLTSRRDRARRDQARAETRELDALRERLRTSNPSLFREAQEQAERAGGTSPRGGLRLSQAADVSRTALGGRFAAGLLIGPSLRATEAIKQERREFERVGQRRGRRQSLLAAGAGTSSSLRLGQPTLLG